MARRLPILLLAIFAAGCSTYNERIASFAVSRSPQVPPDLIDKTDGVYKGIGYLTLARSPVCPTTRFGTVEIGDRTLYFALTPTTLFITPVQPDGTVETQIPGARLEGKLQDGRLIFAASDSVCETRFDLRRVL